MRIYSEASEQDGQIEINTKAVREMFQHIYDRGFYAGRDSQGGVESLFAGLDRLRWAGEDAADLEAFRRGKCWKFGRLEIRWRPK